MCVVRRERERERERERDACTCVCKSVCELEQVCTGSSVGLVHLCEFIFHVLYNVVALYMYHISNTKSYSSIVVPVCPVWCRICASLHPQGLVPISVYSVLCETVPHLLRLGGCGEISCLG